jgi:hypothetical protein
MTCTYGFAGKGSWGNQYSVTGKKANEFSSLTVDDKGKTGKVTFKGKAGDGTPLEGTIDCHQLMRGDG